MEACMDTYTSMLDAITMSEADLIEEVREHELLWDPTHEDYYNKQQRELVWTLIQLKFGPATAFNVATRWTRLRQAHAKALLRLKKRPFGSGGAGWKPWKHLEAMTFLLAIKEQPRDTVTNYVVEDECDNDDVEEGMRIGTEDRNLEKETASHSQEDTTLSAVFPVELISPPPKVVEKISATPRKRSRDPDSDDTTVYISEAKSNKKQFHQFSPPPVESHRMGFFRSILPEVDNLSSSDFLKFQMSVLKALSEVTPE